VEESGGEDAPVALDLDRERISSSEQGRRGWARDARRQLDERRTSEARPIARSRADRLLEAARRLEEEHAAECEANAAYGAYRARGVMKDGRRFGAPPKPYEPPETPAGRINTTDHDSRIVRTTGQPARQGYNAQAAVTEEQIIVAAEVTVDSPDFGAATSGKEDHGRTRTSRQDSVDQEGGVRVCPFVLGSAGALLVLASVV